MGNYKPFELKMLSSTKAIIFYISVFVLNYLNSLLSMIGEYSSKPVDTNKFIFSHSFFFLTGIFSLVFIYVIKTNLDNGYFERLKSYGFKNIQILRLLFERLFFFFIVIIGIVFLTVILLKLSGLSLIGLISIKTSVVFLLGILFFSSFLGFLFFTTGNIIISIIVFFSYSILEKILYKYILHIEDQIFFPFQAIGFLRKNESIPIAFFIYFLIFLCCFCFVVFKKTVWLKKSK